MKRGYILFCISLLSLCSYAQMNATFGSARVKAERYYASKVQETMDSIKRKDPKVFCVAVGKLNIKDKVFVTNKTTYYIEKAVIGFIDLNMKFQTIATASNVSPGQKTEIISFDKNGLETVQKRALVLKVKGSNNGNTQENEEVKSSFEADANSITYDFDAILSEVRHDLYIDIIHKKSNDILDF